VTNLTWGEANSLPLKDMALQCVRTKIRLDSDPRVLQEFPRTSERVMRRHGLTIERYQLLLAFKIAAKADEQLTVRNLDAAHGCRKFDASPIGRLFCIRVCILRGTREGSKHASQPGQRHPVSRTTAEPTHLPSRHRELVTQQQNLDLVLGVRAAMQHYQPENMPKQPIRT